MEHPWNLGLRSHDRYSPARALVGSARVLFLARSESHSRVKRHCMFPSNYCLGWSVLTFLALSAPRVILECSQSALRLLFVLFRSGVENSSWSCTAWGLCCPNQCCHEKTRLKYLTVSCLLTFLPKQAHVQTQGFE